MTSKDIKEMRINHTRYPMGEDDYVPKVSRLIYRNNIIYPKPNVSGITIGERWDGSGTGFQKMILMSLDGIISSMNSENLSGTYTKLESITSKEDIMILEVQYLGGSLSWKFPDGTYAKPDIFYDMGTGYKIDANDEWQYLYSTHSSDSVSRTASYDDEGEKHLFRLYLITED